MNLKKLLSATVVATVFALSACGDKVEKIKVGVMSGPEHQIAELAAKIAKEKYNRDVELVSFTDYGSPNEEDTKYYVEEYKKEKLSKTQ